MAGFRKFEKYELCKINNITWKVNNNTVPSKTDVHNRNNKYSVFFLITLFCNFFCIHCAKAYNRHITNIYMYQMFRYSTTVLLITNFSSVKSYKVYMEIYQAVIYMNLFFSLIKCLLSLNLLSMYYWKEKQYFIMCLLCELFLLNSWHPENNSIQIICFHIFHKNNKCDCF